MKSVIVARSNSLRAQRAIIDYADAAPALPLLMLYFDTLTLSPLTSPVHHNTSCYALIITDDVFMRH